MRLPHEWKMQGLSRCSTVLVLTSIEPLVNSYPLPGMELLKPTDSACNFVISFMCSVRYTHSMQSASNFNNSLSFRC